MTLAYTRWRGLHLASSGLLGLIASIHCALTWVMHANWTPDAVWFFGTGLGLMLLSALNVSHIGVEPCRQPTTQLVRAAYWVFLLFGVAATYAVPAPQALFYSRASARKRWQAGLYPGPV